MLRLLACFWRAAKCGSALGQAEHAQALLFQAADLLRQPSCPANEADVPPYVAGSALLPGALLGCHLEAAAVLLVESQLLLDTPGGKTRPPGARTADRHSRRTAALEKLHRAFGLCCNAPLLLSKVAGLLAILYAQSSLAGDSSAAPEALRDAQLAAFFHHASVGATGRQRHRSLLQSKLQTQRQRIASCRQVGHVPSQPQ
eukprot:jgi/Mesen1/3901/ME000208S02913